MHTSFFETKQAHLASLRFGRRETALVALTPTRLDMLRTILERGGKLRQHRLRHLLGVSNAVVSVMVRALETLGFVTRKRCDEDQRTFVVALTKQAATALRRVEYETKTMGFMDLALVSAFTPEHMFRTGWVATVNRFSDSAAMLRAAFGIGRTGYDPWATNDDDESFYFAEVAGNPNRRHLFEDAADEPDGGPPIYLEE